MRKYRLAVVTLVLAALALAPAGAGASDEWIVVTVISYPEKLPLVVDGVVYTPGQTGGVYTFRWTPGEPHTVQILVDTVYKDAGSRLVFTGWNDGTTTHEVTVAPTQNTSIVALYDWEAYLGVKSKYGHPQGQGWYRVGTTARISVESVVSLGPGARAVFAGWSGGYDPMSNETLVLVLEAGTVRAEWRIEYYLNASSNIGAPVIGGGWHEAGRRVDLRAPLTVDAGSGVVYKFRAWNVTEGQAIVEDPSSSHTTLTLEGPASIVAEYDTYYRVTVSTRPGQSEEKLVREGDTLEAVVEKTVIPTGPGERLVFRGWSNGDTSPATSITITAPTSLRAEWGTQYQVSIAEGPVPVRGAGWYWAGDKAVITAPPEYPARLGAKYVFSHWRGDASGDSPRLELTVNGPISLEAVYEKNYTGTLASLGVVAAAGLGTISILGAARGRLRLRH